MEGEKYQQVEHSGLDALHRSILAQLVTPGVEFERAEPQDHR
jgi:hypothetical protein